jgi:hypothetical protein
MLSENKLQYMLHNIDPVDMSYIIDSDIIGEYFYKLVRIVDAYEDVCIVYKNMPCGVHLLAYRLKLGDKIKIEDLSYDCEEDMCILNTLKRMQGIQFICLPANIPTT